MYPPCPARLAPGAVSALLAVLLVLAETVGAQFSQTPVGLRDVASPPEPHWPVVNFGLFAPSGVPDTSGGPINETIPSETRAPFDSLIGSFAFGDDGRVVELRANVPAGGLLGPVDYSLVPQPGDPANPETAGEAAASDPARIQVGNVSFNRSAASLDVRKVDDVRPSDLSRQFESPVAAANVAPSVPLTGWTIVAIAALAVIIALAISLHQSDRRRRKHRHRRHRHSSHGA